MGATAARGYLDPVQVLDAVLGGRLGIDAQLGRGHKLTNEGGMAHRAMMEMRETTSGDDERVLRVVQRAFGRLVERADGVVIVTRGLLIGVHVGEAVRARRIIASL